MIRTAFAGFLALSLLLLAGCGGGDEARESEAPDTSSAAGAGQPTVSLEGVTGPDRTIADYSGKILIVNQVATWHEDSKALVEIMNEITRKFYRNVTVVAVSMDDRGEAGVRNFVAAAEPDFEVFLPGESFKEAFGSPRRLPMTWVLTREAGVYQKIEGLQRYDIYHDTIIEMYRKRM